MIHVKARKVVRRLGEVKGISVLSGLLQQHLNALERVLSPSIRSGKADAALIFGLPGVGKTVLAVALAQRLATEFPRLSAIFVDCELASSIPDVQGRRARRIVDPFLGDLNLLRGMGRDRIVVLDSVEFLSMRQPGGTALRILSQLLGLFAEPVGTTILIGTTRDPSKVDPAVLELFGKRLYVQASEIGAIPKLLRVAGMKEDKARAVAAAVGDIVGELDIAYVAPASLLYDLDHYVGLDRAHTEDPRIVAGQLCSSSVGSFVARSVERDYEARNEHFINQSSLLGAILGISKPFTPAG